jgi:hypothetical protein
MGGEADALGNGAEAVLGDAAPRDAADRDS